MIRVFPRRTSYTPTDNMAFIGDPPIFRPKEERAYISCVFTWDKPEAERLAKSWGRFYQVEIGGPAYDDSGGEFVPGRFVRPGVTITSRGCPYSCPWCYVPKREGKLRTLLVHPGNVVNDNNLLACPEDHQHRVFDMLAGQKAISFSGGLDARLLKDWHVEVLHNLRIYEMWFAADTDNLAPLERASKMLEGFSQKRKRCYVLIGFRGESIEQADRRLQRVYDLGFIPFAQFYRGPGEQTKTPEWSAFTKAWSRPAIIYCTQKERVSL